MALRVVRAIGTLSVLSAVSWTVSDPEVQYPGIVSELLSRTTLENDGRCETDDRADRVADNRYVSDLY